MSHFSQVKTQIKNMGRLRSALSRLGYTLEESHAGVEVRGFFGETTRANAKFHAGKNYDLGFVTSTSGDLELVGDWEILPKILGKSRDDFAKELKRTYARVTVEEVAQKQGLVIEEQEQDNGEVEYVLTSWEPS